MASAAGPPARRTVAVMATGSRRQPLPRWPAGRRSVGEVDWPRALRRGPWSHPASPRIAADPVDRGRHSLRTVGRWASFASLHEAWASFAPGPGARASFAPGPGLRASPDPLVSPRWPVLSDLQRRRRPPAGTSIQHSCPNRRIVVTAGAHVVALGAVRCDLRRCGVVWRLLLGPRWPSPPMIAKSVKPPCTFALELHGEPTLLAIMSAGAPDHVAGRARSTRAPRSRMTISNEAYTSAPLSHWPRHQSVITAVGRGSSGWTVLHRRNRVSNVSRLATSLGHGHRWTAMVMRRRPSWSTHPGS